MVGIATAPKKKKSDDDDPTAILCDGHSLKRPNAEMGFWLAQLLVESSALPPRLTPPLIAAALRFIGVSEGAARSQAMHTLSHILRGRVTLALPRWQQRALVALVSAPFGGQLELLHAKESLRCTAYMSALVELQQASAAHRGKTKRAD